MLNITMLWLAILSILPLFSKLDILSSGGQLIFFICLFPVIFILMTTFNIVIAESFRIKDIEHDIEKIKETKNYAGLYDKISGLSIEYVKCICNKFLTYDIHGKIMIIIEVLLFLTPVITLFISKSMPKWQSYFFF